MFGFGKKGTYAAKWKSYHNPRGGYMGGFSTKKQAQNWLRSYEDKGPESGVQGKVVKEQIKKMVEQVLLEADDVQETPQEYAKEFLPGGTWNDIQYSWMDVIEEINSYFDREYPVTEKVFKDLTGVTIEQYETLQAREQRRKEIDEQLEDLDWDIDNISELLDDDEIRLATTRNALVELKADLRSQRDELRQELANL